jgi:hypothetical protein
MTDIPNRSQRRAQLRRAIKNRKENIDSRASDERKLARIGRHRDAHEINRERAMKAAGIPYQRQGRLSKFLSSTFGKDGLEMWKVWALFLLTVLVVIWLGRSNGMFSFSFVQKPQGLRVGKSPDTRGSVALTPRDRSALSII